MRTLSDRLRHVRVCCGDWSRVLTPVPTEKQGVTGVFLDPPYSRDRRRPNTYAVESDVVPDVREWCIDHEDDPDYRIALCGYEGEGHEVLERRGWSVFKWKANGGYGNFGGKSLGSENPYRERVWFSPHCADSSGYLW